MKLLSLFLFSILSWIVLPAQSVQWTWISGDSTGNQLDVYGNRRVLDPVNKPGSIAPLNSWTDKAGNFYMFGGNTSAIRFGIDTIPVFTNALWKYSPAKNAWAMLTGFNSSSPAMSGGGGVFGTPGVPAPDNTPEILEYSGATWTDTSGNWWLLNGKTGYRDFGTKNQLWKFNPLLGQWTYMRGGADDSSPSYGSNGIPASSNTPGARLGMTIWTDQEDHLYLYGGYFSLANHVQNYGDVWKYDPPTNLWTWVSGRRYQGIIDGPVYGTKGVFAAENTPGAGAGYTLKGPDSNGIVSMYISRELWNFSVKTNQWAWISGDRKINANPDPTPKRNYGIKGVPSAGNNPGPRSRPVVWTDTAGNQWLFGGDFEDQFHKRSYFNDLWKYTAQTGEWTWVDGDSSLNRPPDYGAKGMLSPTNQPGGRSGSVTWRDVEGNLWLFGGARQSPKSQTYNWRGYQDGLNDLWKLSIAGNIVSIKLSDFSATQKDERVVLLWNTSQERNTKEFIIQRSPDSIQFTTIGTVAAAGNTSTVSRYEFSDHAPLSGNNFYRLKQVNLNDAFVYSALAKVSIQITEFAYRLFPNPVLHELRMALKTNEAVTVQVRVSDASGHLLISKPMTVAQGMSIYTIPVRQLAGGIHFISIIKDKKTITKRFYKSPTR